MSNHPTLYRLNVRAAMAVISALVALGLAQHCFAAAAPAAIVQVAPAANARLAPTRWVPGSVVSLDDAKIASAEAGRLDFVADVGTRVKAGDRIAQLDDRALRLRREEIQSDVARAEAQRALSAVQLDRLNKLVTSNAIAKTQIDEAKATLETSVQALAHAKAQLHQIEYDIEQANVRAPFSGVVTERFAQRGEYLQIGANIVHLVDIGHIEARVQAPLKLADKLVAGTTVNVKSNGVTTPAKVRAVVPVGDETARQFELRVGLDPQLALVGSAIEVSLPEDAGSEALTVPRDAIVQREDKTYVMRVSPANVAEQIAVSTRNPNGDRVEVTGALNAGDRLVVRGAERLAAGQAVRIADGS